MTPEVAKQIKRLHVVNAKVSRMRAGHRKQWRKLLCTGSEAYQRYARRLVEEYSYDPRSDDPEYLTLRQELQAEFRCLSPTEQEAARDLADIIGNRLCPGPLPFPEYWNVWPEPVKRDVELPPDFEPPPKAIKASTCTDWKRIKRRHVEAARKPLVRLVKPGTALSETALAILGNAEAGRDILKLPMDSANAKTTREVQEAIQSVSGVWSKRRNGYVFAEHLASDALDQLLMIGAMTGKWYRFDKIEPTPRLADMVIAHAGLTRGSCVLVPAAGRGALLKAMVRANLHSAEVYAIEADEDSRHALERLDTPFIQVSIPDETSIYSFKPVRKSFTEAVMTPPLTDQQDIDYVVQCLRLPVIGRITAVMSRATLYRSDEKSRRFRELLTVGDAVTVDVEAGLCRTQDVSIDVVIVVIRSVRKAREWLTAKDKETTNVE